MNKGECPTAEFNSGGEAFLRLLDYAFISIPFLKVIRTSSAE